MSHVCAGLMFKGSAATFSLGLQLVKKKLKLIFCCFSDFPKYFRSWPLFGLDGYRLCLDFLSCFQHLMPNQRTIFMCALIIWKKHVFGYIVVSQSGANFMSSFAEGLILRWHFHSPTLLIQRSNMPNNAIHYSSLCLSLTFNAIIVIKKLDMLSFYLFALLQFSSWCLFHLLHFDKPNLH